MFLTNTPWCIHTHTHRPLFANTYSAVYDIVITGGLVHDGTGAKPVLADVAIIDGRVALIGDVKGSGHVMCVTSPSLLLLPCCRWRAYLVFFLHWQVCTGMTPRARLSRLDSWTCTRITTLRHVLRPPLPPTPTLIANPGMLGCLTLLLL